MLQKDIEREQFARAARAGYQGRAKRDLMEQTNEKAEYEPRPTNKYPPGRSARYGGNGRGQGGGANG